MRAWAVYVCACNGDIYSTKYSAAPATPAAAAFIAPRAALLAVTCAGPVALVTTVGLVKLAIGLVELAALKTANELVETFLVMKAVSVLVTVPVTVEVTWMVVYCCTEAGADGAGA